MILPRVKEQRELGGFFGKTLVFPETNEGNAASKLLELFSPGLALSHSGNVNVLISKEAFKIKGEYKLSVKIEEISICYGDYEGLRNAVATLSGLEEKGKIRCADIWDYPDNGFRSCLFDLARGYVPIDELKENLVRIARMKFNVAHLHLMDRQSYILESDVVPNPDNHRLYSKGELRDIVLFCNLLGLDAIPEIEFPAHAVNLLKSVPELECDIIDMKKAQDRVAAASEERKVFFIDNERQVSRWAVCVGKESTYEIYDAIIDEIVEIFDSEYIHIGGDEIVFEHLGAFPNWDNCEHCKKLMEKYNSDIMAVYHHGIRRINEIVKSKGKKTIKWNESKENEHSVDIPNDIIIQFWRSDDTSESVSHIERFINMGYSLINAEYPYTYVDLQDYMAAKKIKNWTPAKSEKQKSAILGGEMCAWELGNPDFSYYSYTLPICMAFFCDRVWNTEPCEYDSDYTKAVFAVAMGENDLSINPLEIFEEIIPPRKKNLLETLDKDVLKSYNFSSLICGLKAINAEKCYGKIALKEFIAYIENLKNAIE